MVGDCLEAQRGGGAEHPSISEIPDLTHRLSTGVSEFGARDLPNSPDLNPAAGETRANMVVATVNPGTGKSSVFNNTGSLDVIVDVLGWYS